MQDRADDLGDRAHEQIGADRDERIEPKHEDQDRREQRPAADAGRADQQADPETEPDDGEHVLHQWRKYRCDEKTSEMPSAFAAAITSSSRTPTGRDHGGTAAAAAACRPSANGKNPSLAHAAPFAIARTMGRDLTALTRLV